MTRFPKSLALAAGLVSALGFAPLGWWPLTLACLALLIHLVAEAPAMRGALARGYWFGAGHFIVGLNWIAGSFQYQDSMPKWLGWIAVLLLSFYLAIYPAMAAGLAWLCSRRIENTDEERIKPLQKFLMIPFQILLVAGGSLDFSHPAIERRTRLVIFFSAGWILTEYFRATAFTGFAWNPLAAIWGQSPILAQIASIIGTYGLSGLIVLTAGGLLLTIMWLRRPTNPLRHEGMRSGAIVALLILPLAVVAAFLPALLLTRTTPVSDGPLIRIVQPNIGQQDKHEKAFEKRNFEKLASLTGKPGAKPRLILWPEAAIPDYLEEEEWARDRIARLIGPKDMLVTGGVALVEEEPNVVVAARNSTFVLTPRSELIARYDKAHLVPYGEYLPMRPILSAIGLSRLVPGDLDFWPGPGPQSFGVPGFGRMGVQICYEIIFSGHVVDRRNRPDFLFNPSNDAWFGAWGPPQHLAQARLRAIEEGIPVIRSTPTGISAVIDADGNLLHSLPYRKAGFIEARLPEAHAPTLFARYGNILSFALAFFLAALGIALGRVRR